MIVGKIGYNPLLVYLYLVNGRNALYIRGWGKVAVPFDPYVRLILFFTGHARRHRRAGRSLSRPQSLALPFCGRNWLFEVRSSLAAFS